MGLGGTLGVLPMLMKWQQSDIELVALINNGVRRYLKKFTEHNNETVRVCYHLIMRWLKGILGQ